MKTNVSCETKGLLMELDDITVRMEMGLANLSYMLEELEYRNADASLVEAFCCPLYYLRGIHEELNNKVQLLFAELKEGNV